MTTSDATNGPTQGTAEKGDSSSELSLIVPTKNRPQFVARLLRYFSSAKFNGKILLGDSSTGEAKNSIDSLVAQYRCRLELAYLDLPGLSGPQALGELTNAVETRHIAFSPDDDFQIVPTLLKCSSVLDSLPDHVAVHGIANIVTLGGAGGETPLNSRPYDQIVLAQNNARDRLLAYMQGAAHPLFSVFRTNDWRAIFSDVSRVPDQAIGGEFLPSCLAAIRGKIAQLDCLSLVRTDHEGRTLTRHAPFVSRMCSAAWHPSVEILQSRVVEELQRAGGMSAIEANDIFLDGFGGYLAMSLRKRRQSRDIRSRIRGAGGLVPGGRWIRSKIRKLGIGKASSLSLDALRDGYSPYRKDFELAIDSLRSIDE